MRAGPPPGMSGELSRRANEDVNGAQPASGRLKGFEPELEVSDEVILGEHVAGAIGAPERLGGLVQDTGGLGGLAFSQQDGRFGAEDLVGLHVTAHFPRAVEALPGSVRVGSVQSFEVGGLEKKG